MPFGLGFGETILIFLILVLLFGPGKLPEIGNALGKGIRDFKDAVSGADDGEEPNRIGSPARLAPLATVPTHDPVAAAMRAPLATEQSTPPAEEPPAAPAPEEASSELVTEAVVPPDPDRKPEPPRKD